MAQLRPRRRLVLTAGAGAFQTPMPGVPVVPWLLSPQVMSRRPIQRLSRPPSGGPVQPTAGLASFVAPVPVVVTSEHSTLGRHGS